MELRTSKFGSIVYHAHEVIHFETGIDGQGGSQPWLLLADAAHPHLFWLQSLEDAERAIPVVGMSQSGAGESLVCRAAAAPQDLGPRPALVVLNQLDVTPAGLAFQMDSPILIDPRSGRGARMPQGSAQTVQRARSEKVAPLRECA